MNFKQSFSYFVIFLLILNIIFIGSIFTKTKYDHAYSLLQSLITNLKQVPDDYQVQITNGLLITNYDRPYFLWLDNNNSKRLISVVDEFASPDKINSYKSLFLLTAREIVTKTNGQIQTSPISSLGSLTINKQFILKNVITLEKILRFLPLIYIGILLVFIIIIPISSILVTGIYLLISSFFGYCLYKIFKKKKTTWKKTFQIAFHAATLPLITDYLIIIFKPFAQMQTMFSLPQRFFPLLFISLLTLFIFAGIYEAHEHPKT